MPDGTQQSSLLSGKENPIELFTLWNGAKEIYEASLAAASEKAHLMNTIRDRLIGSGVTLAVTADPSREQGYASAPEPASRAAAPVQQEATRPAQQPQPQHEVPVPFQNSLAQPEQPQAAFTDEGKPLPDAARIAQMAQPRDTVDLVLGQYGRGTYNFDRASRDGSGKIVVETEHGQAQVQLAKRVPLPAQEPGGGGDDTVAQARALAGVQGPGLDQNIQLLAQQQMAQTINQYNLVPPGQRNYFR